MTRRAGCNYIWTYPTRTHHMMYINFFQGISAIGTPAPAMVDVALFFKKVVNEASVVAIPAEEIVAKSGEGLQRDAGHETGEGQESGGGVRSVRHRMASGLGRKGRGRRDGREAILPGVGGNQYCRRNCALPLDRSRGAPRR